MPKRGPYFRYLKNDKIDISKQTVHDYKKKIKDAFFETNDDFDDDDSNKFYEKFENKTTSHEADSTV